MLLKDLTPSARSRKFMPERTRVFLEYLTEQTRIQINQAMQACDAC
jgi:hypothetical protein